MSSRQTLLSIVFFMGAVALCGCSGLTQMQDSLTKFDDGAHAVAIAQMRFFDNVHRIGCEQQFYQRARDFASSAGAPLELGARCTAAGNPISSARLRTRQQLFDAITLYADQLQALGAPGDQALTDHLQSAATDLNQLATDRGLITATDTLPGNVETAVAALTRVVIDHRRYTDIKAAAQSQQANLALVVATLKRENVTSAIAIDSAIGTMRGAMTEALLAGREREREAVAVDVVLARAHLQAMQAYGQSGIDESVDDSVDAASPALAGAGQVARLNLALDGLVSANDALARADSGGVRAAVADLVARARAAQAFKTALTP